MGKENTELQEAIMILEKEKNISRDTLLDAIEIALLSAYKNHFGKSDNAKVVINHETCAYAVYAEKTVVETVEDPVMEMDLEDARKIVSDAKLGDIMQVPIESKAFGRIATQNAKNQILQKIREKYTFPVIMLTAKTEYMDKITGLTMGADDYIPKPFNPLELVARVKAQLRRYTQYNDGSKAVDDVIDFAGLVLNRDSHECIYNERELTLTPIEFNILWILCENRGKVISSEELFERVWEEQYYKNSNNTVMVHIRHLREKMSGPSGKSDFIKTVWGVGYKVES